MIRIQWFANTPLLLIMRPIHIGCRASVVSSCCIISFSFFLFLLLISCFVFPPSLFCSPPYKLLVKGYIPYLRFNSPPPQQPSSICLFFLTGLLPPHRFPLLSNANVCLLLFGWLWMLMDVYGCLWMFFGWLFGTLMYSTLDLVWGLTPPHIRPSGITYIHS